MAFIEDSEWSNDRSEEVELARGYQCGDGSEDQQEKRNTKKALGREHGNAGCWEGGGHNGISIVTSGSRLVAFEERKDKVQRAVGLDVFGLSAARPILRVKFEMGREDRSSNEMLFAPEI